MLQLNADDDAQHLMHKISETNYNSSCTVRSSENICSSSQPVEALKKKERQDETQFTTKIDGFPKDRMRLSLLPKLMVFQKTG